MEGRLTVSEGRGSGSSPQDPALPHLDVAGNARMVDVSHKAPTARRACASCQVRMSAEAHSRALQGDLPKGAVHEVVRLAAIQGAKHAAQWIPLCHPLALTGIDVDLTTPRIGLWQIRVTVRAVDRTGVEMEAMTGAALGALALYDMVKGVDRSACVERLELREKSGGKSGTWSRPEHDA